jgi:hypothetical protein
VIVPADGGPPRGFELFDLAADPYCRTNLLPIVERGSRVGVAGGAQQGMAGSGPAAAWPPVASTDTSLARAAWQTLRPALDRWVEGAAPVERSEDPALLQRLRALGYAQ